MASEEPLFDPSLMKKKKGKKADLTKELDALDEPAPAAAPAEAAAESTAAATDAAAPAAEAADEENMFADLKKKKKSKMLIPMDLDDLDNASTPAAAATSGDATPAAPAEGEAENDDLDFGEMKKKKKKGGKKAAFDLEAFEKELGEDSKGEGASSGTTAAAPAAGGEGGEDEDLGDDPFAAGDDGEEAGEAKEAVETWHGTDRDYTYQELLGRVFSTLRAQNPAMAGEKKKYTIVPPQVMRDGSKKTVFANVVEICKRMHRQPDHVIQYLFSELGTEGSVDGAQRLVIKGRFQPKQIENVLRRYILEYVTCKTCKSPRTLLTKENRIFFLVCEACGSQRSVTTIKTGFQAQTGKRSKMRAQT